MLMAKASPGNFSSSQELSSPKHPRLYCSTRGTRTLVSSQCNRADAQWYKGHLYRTPSCSGAILIWSEGDVWVIQVLPH